jgi:hypothetical protein
MFFQSVLAKISPIHEFEVVDFQCKPKLQVPSFLGLLNFLLVYFLVLSSKFPDSDKFSNSIWFQTLDFHYLFKLNQHLLNMHEHLKKSSY